MRNLGPCRFRGAAGVRAIADNDYYHSECASKHDKNHDGKDQHLLNAAISGSGLRVYRQV
jgi:hypothetical protein